VKFKVDENLPVEAAKILCDAGYAADTVADESLSGSDDQSIAARSRSEGRILVTLDLEFANIQASPPGTHAGIVVFRLKQPGQSNGARVCTTLSCGIAPGKHHDLLFDISNGFSAETPTLQ